MGASTPPHDLVNLGTFADLLEKQEEIVARIAATLNGGHLFLAHPFQCLADLNVQLSSELQASLMSRDSSLKNLSLKAYNSIKSQTSAQPVHVRVHGLFKKG